MRILVLIGLVAHFIGITASAQMPMMRMPHVPTEFKMPPVGAWSLYRIMGTEEKDTLLFKYSLTGEEKCGETKCYWFELQTEQNEEANIIKMLISGDPDDPGNVKRLIIKSGDDPAIEIPLAEMQILVDEPENTELEQKTEEKESVTVGEETIITPAGELKCKHIRISFEEEKTDIWSSEDIPFFGLARLVQKDSYMEVVGYDESGAKTAITEEPQKMPMPGLPGTDE